MHLVIAKPPSYEAAQHRDPISAPVSPLIVQLHTPTSLAIASQSAVPTRAESGFRNAADGSVSITLMRISSTAL